jgi:hypothetical protein
MNENTDYKSSTDLKINAKALRKIDCNINLAHLGCFDWNSTFLNIVKRDLHADKVVFVHGTIPAQELKTEEFKKIALRLVFFSCE